MKNLWEIKDFGFIYLLKQHFVLRCLRTAGCRLIHTCVSQQLQQVLWAHIELGQSGTNTNEHSEAAHEI